jgi:hypothetical protein
VARGLTNRFTETADFSLIVAAFLLSLSRHASFQMYRRNPQYPDFLECQATKGLEQRPAAFDISCEEMIKVFYFYLWEMDVSARSASRLWTGFLKFVAIRTTQSQEEYDRRQTGEMRLAIGAFQRPLSLRWDDEWPRHPRRNAAVRDYSVMSETLLAVFDNQ